MLPTARRSENNLHLESSVYNPQSDVHSDMDDIAQIEKRSVTNPFPHT
jgi:hypothetical protein